MIFRRVRFVWDLRSLILGLALLAALLSVLNGLQAAYQVQRQLLIEHTLETHHAYAAKVAASTQTYLKAISQLLAFGGSSLAEHLDDPVYLQREANRLRGQVDSFNSVVITRADGMVLATSPETLELQGKPLDSPGARQALRERRPLISAPYLSAVGNLVVFISQPIFDLDGNYLGYVGGSIYLRRPNILNELLGQHFFEDGSYIFVVDAQKRLIFHPDTARIGETIQGNTLFDTLPEGASGRLRLTNSQGVAMLAGFARIPASDWVVVSERPEREVLEPLNAMLGSMLLKGLPIGLLCLLGIGWCSRVIARPLQRMADEVSDMQDGETARRLQPIRAWYQEAAELKRALLQSFGLLNARIGQLQQDVQTDPLTGLANRRALEERVDLWQRQGRPFAVVALDIDHFKRVNDAFGHDAGDRVLVHLAMLMRSCLRQDDLPCRVGGEEFSMLLPNSDSRAAARVADRLRESFAGTPLDDLGTITISLGVSHWSLEEGVSRKVFKRADEALYAAKRGGRNQVVVAGD